MTPCPNCSKPFQQTEQEIAGVILRFPSECPDCSKATKEKLEAETKAEMERAENERIELWIKNSRIPPKYATIRDYQPKDETQRIVWDFKKNLVFIGQCGSGKTHLACAIAIIGIIKYKKTARYFTHYDLIRYVRNAWDKNSVMSENEIMRELATTDILIIDEIDKQEYTNQLFQIMDGRYSNQKPTIIIGNATTEEVKAILGDALSSRLREFGAVIKPFSKIDYRINKE
jgi:DNA replication protein DnaC